MKDLLTPDFMFSDYAEVTPKFLKEKGIRALLSDLDNTLAPYEQPEPDEKIVAWVKNLQKNGIKIALISNNHPERVERFNRSLGLPAYPNSHKPLKKMLLVAMKDLGVTKAETAVLGDQLLTDSYAGKHIGLPSLIVPPIRDKKNLFFRFKRLLERKFIRRYAKKNGYSAWMSFWKIKAGGINA